MSTVKNFKFEREESYARGDNNILYPQTEVIRFLNRYVCKRNYDESITKLIKTLNDRPPVGLDFACGVGTHCITFADFEVEGWGGSISLRLRFNKLRKTHRFEDCLVIIS